VDSAATYVTTPSTARRRNKGRHPKLRPMKNDVLQTVDVSGALPGTRRLLERRIARHLRDALAGLGATVELQRGDDDYRCDLVITRPFKAIFEIKSAFNPQNCYSAIGQLFSYRHFSRWRQASLVFVFEEQPETRFSDVLEYLEIHLLGFLLDDADHYQFPQIRQLMATLQRLSSCNLAFPRRRAIEYSRCATLGPRRRRAGSTR